MHQGIVYSTEEQAAERLHISLSTLRRWMKKGTALRISTSATSSGTATPPSKPSLPSTPRTRHSRCRAMETGCTW
jgi:transposase